jgi:hypothetical protein
MNNEQNPPFEGPLLLPQPSIKNDSLNIKKTDLVI